MRLVFQRCLRRVLRNRDLRTNATYLSSIAGDAVIGFIFIRQFKTKEVAEEWVGNVRDWWSAFLQSLDNGLP